MKKTILFLLTLSCFSVKAQTPTWADHVACIVYSHCTSCHNPNGAAPFSLMNYSDAVDNASKIKDFVEKRIMPPWPVDNGYRKMAHNRNLSDNEINTIVEWVNKGTVQGNMLNAPSQPYYSSFIVISNPDLKLKIPTYKVPVITQDLYRCFVMPTGLSVQKFITGIEIIPGNKNIVHHAQVFYDTTGVSSTLDASDPNPGYTSVGGVGTDDAVLLGTWVPGSSPIFVPLGMGKKLPTNAKIVVQIHYPEYASGETDSTKVNFLFTTNAVRNISDAPILNHSTSMTDGPLFIPKNTVKTFHQKFVVPINVTLLSIGPHAHLICTSMKAYGITLAGDTIKLINVPKWNFHWQGSYDFQQPVKIPFGTALYGEATYDNTTANAENPNNPPIDVSLGESTTDEMMLFYFSYLPYKNGDENIIIDTANHQFHHNNCQSNFTSVQFENIFEGIKLYPNPVNTYFNINVSGSADFQVSVINVLGQIVIKSKNTSEIDISTLPKGVYYVMINQAKRSYTSSLLKE